MSTLFKPIGLEELSQRIVALPTNLRTFYVSEHTTDALEAIQTKQALDDAQMGMVIRATSRVLLGLLPVKDFVTTLGALEGVGNERARNIAQDINEQIFQPVREELLQVHGIQHGTDNMDHEAGHVSQPEQDAEHETVNMKHETGNIENEEDGDRASQKREELLARLREAQNAPITPPPPLTPQEPEPPASPNGSEGGPKPVTAAWNGKTIDLSKIPPRRQLNGNGHKNGEEEIRTVQLKKGPDGYWYEI